MQISGTPRALPPVGGTAGALQTQFGETFRQLGALSRGAIVDARTLMLVFPSNAEAAAAAALLEPVVDGVRIRVALQNGRPPQGVTTPSAMAAAIEGVWRVHRAGLVETGARPTFQVVVDDHETAARLDWILRDEVLDGVPVRLAIAAPATAQR